ncbi:MAG: hypothetical protein ACE5G6_04025, partial [Terriglobia bacterium]
DGQEQIKVLDFGIAKALAGHWGERKFTETFLGMPGTGGYAAPEQVEARPQDIGAPTDLFAVGVILYNLLTGREPWMGRRVAELGELSQGEGLRLLNRVLDAPAIPPRQWNPELPAELEHLLLKVLAKKPQDRFQSAAELDQALQQVGQPALQSRPAGLPRASPDEIGTSRGAPPPLPEPRPAPEPKPAPPAAQPFPPPVGRPTREAPRRTARNVLVALVLVAGLAASAYLAWEFLTPTERPAEQGEPPEPAPPPAAPTLELRAEPNQIEAGQATTLSWTSSHATELSLDPGLGSVTQEGSRKVSPTEDTTYTLMAKGPGGTTETSVRVTIRHGVLDFLLERTLTDYTDTVYAVVFSPDGRWLASGSGDNSVKLWDVTTGRQARVLLGHLAFVGGAAFSPDGRWLASASGFKDHTVKLWEVATGREVRTLRGHTDTVWTVAFSPDGRWLASAGNDNTIVLWEVATGRKVHTLQGHTQPVMSVVFSPDGRWLVSGSYDHRIKLWYVATGREVRTLGYHPGSVWEVAFSPDGRWLASGGRDKRVKLWDVATWREVRVLRGHGDEVKTVAFSPDGRWLASGSQDGIIMLWEVGTGQLVRTLTGHTDSVQDLAFSPDGRWLASGSSDKTVKLWRRVGPGGTAEAAVPVTINPLLFATDFSARSISEHEGPSCRTFYAEGAYIVRDVAEAEETGCFYALFSAGHFPASVRIEVSVRLRQGPTNKTFGLGFGIPSRESQNLYLFFISGKGSYQVSYLAGSEWRELIPWRQNPVLRQGHGATNQLAVEVAGRTIRVYANGKYLASYEAPAEVHGHIGFHVGGDAEVAFDNLRVTYLPPP